MKKIFITLIVSCIFSLMSNCTLNNFRIPLSCENNSTPLNLLNYSQDTLKITVEASDCGEWGGHREYILLHKDKENRLIANFTVDSVSCDNIISIYEEDYSYSDIDENSRIIHYTSNEFILKTRNAFKRWHNLPHSTYRFNIRLKLLE